MTNVWEFYKDAMHRAVARATSEIRGLLQRVWSRPRRRSNGLLALLLALSFFYPLAVRRASLGPNLLLWTFVLMVGFAGWGSVVQRLALPDTQVSAALRACWGMALVLGLGGWLCLAGLASKKVLIGVVGVGVIAESFRVARGMSPKRYLRRLGVAVVQNPLLVLALSAVAAMLLIDTVAWAWFDDLSARDDKAVYFPLAKEILERGTLLQPFSFRRLCVFGGQEFLHALQLAGGAQSTHLHITDAGLCLAMAAWLAVGHLRKVAPRSRPYLVVLAVILVTLPFVRVNVASENSTLLMALALFCTIEYVDSATPSIRKYALIGLLVGALATFRHSNLLPAAALGLMVCFGREGSLRSRTVGLLTAGACALAFLAPWSVNVWRSSGSLLFPLQRGNYAPSFGLIDVAHPSFSRVLEAAMAYGSAIDVSWFVFALAATALSDKRSARLAVMFLAALMVPVLTFWTISDARPRDVARYAYGFHYAFVLAVVLATAARTGGPRFASSSLSAPLVVAATALYLSARWQDFTTWQTRLTRLALKSLQSNVQWRATDPDFGAPYRELQAQVPAGKAIVAMVDEPFRLDWRRNAVFILDLPGAAAPPPGLPVQQGPSVLLDYFRAQRLCYLIVVDSPSSENLYRREEWKAHRMRKPMTLGIDAFASLPNSTVKSVSGGMRLHDLTMSPSSCSPD